MEYLPLRLLGFELSAPAVVLLALSLSVGSCGGGGSGNQAAVPKPPATFSASSGVAQKGPLIKGSTVTAQELNSGLSPTGQQFSYQVTTDLGAFVPTSVFSSQYIGLSAAGYYYDEVQNAVSSGTVTLTGYSDLAVDTVLNVNLLTTLEYQRIQNLVDSGMTFTAARTQAENEVLAALNIPPGKYGSFDTLDLGGNTDGDHILAAISCLFVYGNSSGPLSRLIANFQSDIGTNGVITNVAIKTALIAAAKAVNTATVAANLTAAYASQGVTFTAANIGDWISQSGDGAIGKFSFQVPAATPSTVFTFPAFVAAQFAGTPVQVTVGQLSVNGTPASGAVSFKAGDIVTLTPGAGAFPNGVLTSYLVSGGTALAKVSFISGLVSIAVTPSMPSVPLGLTQQFRATGTFSDTSTADLTAMVAWTSSDLMIVSINPTSGLATSLAAGSTVVVAKSGSVSGSAPLIITPAVIESIVITPNPAASGVGLSAQLTAMGTYSDGTVANVTAIANWASGVTSVATVGPTTGVITGVALGSTTISAAIGAVASTAPLSIVTNAWFPTGNLKTARSAHTATLLPNGKVLVAGGTLAATSPSDVTASAELYAPVSGAWSAASNLETARSGHTATLLPNGLVLIVGGTSAIGGGDVLASAELYDPVAGTWSTTGSLATARSGQTATLLKNGSVLVAGGIGNKNTGPALASAELYNPVSGTWSTTGSLALSRSGGAATLLPSGEVLADGGTYGPVTPSDELYDPVAGAWSLTGTSQAGLSHQSATLLPNGKVLVAGGSIAGSAGSNVGCSLYDPVAGTWSTTGSLATGRTAHTATLLQNGTVLVAGGVVNEYGTVAATAEIYDPIAGTWSPGGILATPVFLHTATLLPDGVVLVSGGVSNNALPSMSAELYW